jgi:hypothetical protein
MTEKLKHRLSATDEAMKEAKGISVRLTEIEKKQSKK